MNSSHYGLLLDDAATFDVTDPQRQMFEDLPSRGVSRAGLASRRGKSRMGRRVLSDQDNNALQQDFLDGGLDMIDLEDGSEDPLAETRNLAKIRSMAVPMAHRKSIKYVPH